MGMRTVIVDFRITDEMKEGIVRLGLHPILLSPSFRLGGAVASHPDTLFFKYGDDLISSLDYSREYPDIFKAIRERHPNIKLTLTDDVLGQVYPLDTKFNALVCRGELFARTDSISEEIIRTASRYGLRVNSVRQGYPACSVLSLGKTAILSDRGIARVLSERGIDFTLIREGHISLFPHEYGFIGGASFVYRDKVCFFGDYRLHPDGDFIERSVLAAGLTPVSLAASALTDLGGAVLLE